MIRFALASAAAGLVFVGFALKAQESGPPGAPLPQHKILAMEEGEWDADVTTTVPGPDGKLITSKSKGVETNRLLGGKWLISDFKGEFLNTPFVGHGVNGYDAKKGKYVASWIDSFSTHIDLMDGSYDEKAKKLTLNAEVENPANGKPMKLRLETEFKDDGSRTFTEYVQTEGQSEYSKFMEIKYTKRKK
jgi:hypothetical protein